MDRRRGSGPWWTRGGADKIHGGMSPVRGTQALGVTRARWRGPERTRKMREALGELIGARAVAMRRHDGGGRWRRK
jgi:hypothetical protein